MDGDSFKTCNSPVSYSNLGDGAHTFAVQAVDVSGNVDPTPASFTWTVDTTSPTITGSQTPLPNAAGWNNTPVTVSFAAPIAAQDWQRSPLPEMLTAEGANQSVSRTCTDLAGNTASATVQKINIDLTSPTITVAASTDILWPANGKLVPDTITGTVVDALSGVDPTTVTFRVVDEYGELQPTGPDLVGSGRKIFVQRLIGSQPARGRWAMEGAMKSSSAQWTRRGMPSRSPRSSRYRTIRGSRVGLVGRGYERAL